MIATKTDEQSPTETSSKREPVAPTCSHCHTVLGWVDRVYGRDGSCKRCTQREQRQRLRGVPIPREHLPRPTMSYGADKTKTLFARPRMRPTRKQVSA